MAFTLTAIQGSTSVTLTDGNPFRLITARGMGGVAVRRVTQQGPSQDGDTDTGYRLQPRDVELVIGFSASTDTALDTHRDTLLSVFRPSPSTPVYLRVTRDDAEVRQLDCFAIGDITIDLLPEYRPGHYHRATVRLRAPNPAYYEITPGTVTVTGTAGTEENWWLAGGAIGTAQVMMSGGTPAQGSAWTYTGTIAHSSSYTLAFRATRFVPVGSGSAVYAFYVDNTGAGENDLAFGAFDYTASFPTYFTGSPGTPHYMGTSIMPAGTTNFFWRHDGAGLTDVYGIDNFYASSSFFMRMGTTPISGTARRWRSNAANDVDSRWSGTITHYALYSPGLTGEQLTTLNSYMNNLSGGTLGQYTAVDYDGDLPEFPIINIRGPITNPAITNLVTGHTLDFGTITIGAGTTYVIDTRYGYKTILAGTVNKRGDLSGDSDFGEFHLAPNPIAPSGVNTLLTTGINIGTAMQVSVVYYNRFSSF